MTMKYDELATELVGMARLHAELGADGRVATESTARELDAAHDAGVAEERERWHLAVHEETVHRWRNVSSAACEALTGVLRRMGIAQ